MVANLSSNFNSRSESWPSKNHAAERETVASSAFEVLNILSGTVSLVTSDCAEPNDFRSEASSFRRDLRVTTCKEPVHGSRAFANPISCGLGHVIGTGFTFEAQEAFYNDAEFEATESGGFCRLKQQRACGGVPMELEPNTRLFIVAGKNVDVSPSLAYSSCRLTVRNRVRDVRHVLLPSTFPLVPQRRPSGAMQFLK